MTSLLGYAISASSDSDLLIECLDDCDDSFSSRVVASVLSSAALADLSCRGTYRGWMPLGILSSSSVFFSRLRQMALIYAIKLSTIDITAISVWPNTTNALAAFTCVISTCSIVWIISYTCILLRSSGDTSACMPESMSVFNIFNV